MQQGVDFDEAGRAERAFIAWILLGAQPVDFFGEIIGVGHGLKAVQVSGQRHVVDASRVQIVLVVRRENRGETDLIDDRFDQDELLHGTTKTTKGHFVSTLVLELHANAARRVEQRGRDVLEAKGGERRWTQGEMVRAEKEMKSVVARVQCSDDGVDVRETLDQTRQIVALE